MKQVPLIASVNRVFFMTFLNGQIKVQLGDLARIRAEFHHCVKVLAVLKNGYKDKMLRSSCPRCTPNEGGLPDTTSAVNDVDAVVEPTMHSPSLPLPVMGHHTSTHVYSAASMTACRGSSKTSSQACRK